MSVHNGLEKTWNVLRRTKNEAAVRVLIAALESPDERIQEGALQTLLKRRSVVGQQVLLKRWSSISPRWKQVIAERPGCMTGVLRDAILGGDEDLCELACDAVVWLREYDLTATLITASEETSNPSRHRTAATLLKLGELLHEELAGPRDYTRRRDPQRVRRHMISALERSVQQFHRNRPPEILETFMLLVSRENATLKQILQDPHHNCYLLVIDFLTKSLRAGIMRLLLSYLDDPHSPTAALHVMVNRRDETFLRHLLKKMGYEPSETARINLRKIESVSWLSDQPRLLDAMDDAQQHAAVQLLLATRVNRLQIFPVLRYLVESGKVGGRRAAIAGLANFKGNEANALVTKALKDSDPQVQANALVQLRQRGIPGALGILIEALDHPHKVVQTAARNSLVEFRFPRFLAAFDSLDQNSQSMTGALVRKVDLQTLPLLLKELTAAGRRRRLRGIEVAHALDVVGPMEEQITKLLVDNDHFVRAAAARALGRCHTAGAKKALQAATRDRSVTVREAAEESLRKLEQKPSPSLQTKELDPFVLLESLQATSFAAGTIPSQ